MRTAEEMPGDTHTDGLVDNGYAGKSIPWVKRIGSRFGFSVWDQAIPWSYQTLFTGHLFTPPRT